MADKTALPLRLIAFHQREIYNMIPQLITEQLFNAPRCSHLIPWKDPDTLVIRICRGKPDRSTQDVPVMCFWKRFDFWTFPWKVTFSAAEEIKTEKDTPKGEVCKRCSEKTDMSPLLAVGSSMCVWVLFTVLLRLSDGHLHGQTNHKR